MPELKPPPHGARNQIGRRLIVYIIAFSSAITLCISAVQLIIEYRDLNGELEHEFEEAGIFVPSISGSVWDFDEQQIRRALDALSLLPNVTQVSIAASDLPARWTTGKIRSADVVTRTYSLRHAVRGKDTEIGTLTVVASLDGIYRQLTTRVVTIIIGNGLIIFLVALFMMYLIRRLITSRLERMARKVHTLIPGILPLRQAVEAYPQSIPASLDELDAVDWTLDRTAEDLGIAVSALAKLNEELEQRVQERTKELEAFSYSVSHDLRTPLRAIDSFSRNLIAAYGDKLDAEGKRLLQVVRTNALRMGQLIDDILEFSRMGRQAMGSSPIAMESLVRSVFNDLSSNDSGREILLEIRTLPPAVGDRAMIRQVFENLLTNAIKFTRPRARAQIEVGSFTEAEECVYYVKDNGVGFDMQYVNKLFNVFERLHDNAEFEGTGIGLAIVKRVVTRHGGRVWASSRLDEGTTIYFTLKSRQSPLSGAGSDLQTTTKPR